ncbi:MAG: cation:proton antiporter [Candidatus Aenigmatarchaeota archaeon]
MDIGILFLIIASIVGIGFISNYIFHKTKVPDILFLLLLGVLLGPVLGIFDRQLFLDATPYVSALALLMILFDGGINLKIDKVLRKVPRGTLLAILGFILSTLAVSGTSFMVFEELGVMKSLLLGSIVGGVSSAIVIPVVSELDKFGKESMLTLDVESVITDPLCIIVALVIMDMMTGGVSGTEVTTAKGLSRVVSTFSVSIVVGLVFGFIWLEVLRYIRGKDFHYMLTISFLFFVYASTQVLGGHGAIASFVVGLVLGNAKKISKMLELDKKYFGLTEKTKEFQDQISFFIKTFFFVILGIIITFENPILFLYGGILTLIILLTRYIAVEVVSIGSDFGTLQKGIMTFMSPRGLAAAVLASAPAVEYGIPGTEIFPEIVFSVILGTSVATTIGTVYVEHRIKSGPPSPREVEE